MSEIKNSGLDQYGTEPFEQQQFGTAGNEGVKYCEQEFVTTTGSLINVLTNGQMTSLLSSCRLLGRSKYIQFGKPIVYRGEAKQLRSAER